MRFAYIDSQGKEVAIPSVDALRLRIALRAIVEDTVFFDSASDRWGPAREHEIFRTLKKELDEQEGDTFVAPPPAPVGDAEPPGVEELTDDAGLEVEDLEAPADDAGEGEDDEEWRFAISNAPSDRPEPGEPPADLPPSDPPPDHVDDEDTPLGTSSWLDLDEDESSAEFDLADEHFQQPESDDGAGGELQLVPELGGPDPEAPGDLVLDDTPEFLEHTRLDADTPPSPGSGPAPLEGLSQDRFEADGSLEDVGWGDEPPPQAPVVEDDDTFHLEEEEPPPPPPPPPSRASRAGGDDDLPMPTREDLQSRRAEGPGGGRPRPRPGPPPRRPSRGMGGAAVVGLVAIVAVAGGGAWWYLNRPATEAAPSEELPEAPPVVIPDLPRSLEPRMRAVADEVRTSTLEALRELPAMASLPAEPDPAWLAGVYLANAGQYASVQAYWESMDRFLRVMQAAEDSIFMATLSSNLAAAALPADTAGLLEERIAAGFRATARDRGVIYQRARAVAETSLRLHRFLVENEASIDYEPGVGGLAADPVLEAIPANSAIGDEMWDRVSDITDAMDALDFLDRITTERFVQAIVHRLADIQVR